MSSFAFLLLFITISTTFAQTQTKVPVTVYYESLCPDSIKFYTTQLYPAWNSDLKSYMNLVLVPFGKANYTYAHDNYTFVCHHGEKECIGNRVQACALKKISDMDTKVKYINCLMSKTKESKDGEYPTKRCADENKLAGDVLDSIEHCANSNEGNEYLATLGNMTMKYQNPLRSVPSVVFNNRADDKDKEAVNDFKNVLCSHITTGKPQECTKSGTSAIYPSAAVLLLAAILSVMRH